MRQITVQSRIVIILLALVLAVWSMNRAEGVQAQCSIRNDWGTYMVVRGDTLYRIARRFNTTTAALVQGNCLPNANRIYVGQRLRVPSNSPGAALPPDPGTREWTTGATYQQYENGFMVWRGDNAEIRVYIGALAGDADSIGELTVYSVRQYGSLPSQTFTPPAGRIAPIMGFGKVWGNFPTVQQRLGWAISPEQSHTMTIRVRNGQVIGFTIPGNRWVSFQQGNQWTVSGVIRPTPPPPNPTIIPSDCFVPPYKPGSGITIGTSVVAVTAAPIMNNPPPRGTQIGTLQVGEGAVVIGGPYCFAVDRQHVRAWRVRAFQFAPNEIEGYALEYAVDNNGIETIYLSLAATNQVRIESFTAMPNPVAPGGIITVTWQVVGTQYALLTVLDSATNQPLAIVQELPTAGSTTVSVPATGTSEIRLVLHAANLTTTYPVNMYERLAEASLSVSVATQQTTHTTQAAYQPFENGFMIWLADRDGIYVFGLASVGIYPPTSLRNLPDNPYTDAPTGLFAPVSGFGRVWGNNEQMRKYMGWARTPEQSYQAAVTELSSSLMSISLPDGRVVYIENQTWHW